MGSVWAVLDNHIMQDGMYSLTKTVRTIWILTEDLGRMNKEYQCSRKSTWARIVQNVKLYIHSKQQKARMEKEKEGSHVI